MIDTSHLHAALLIGEIANKSTSLHSLGFRTRSILLVREQVRYIDS